MKTDPPNVPVPLVEDPAGGEPAAGASGAVAIPPASYEELRLGVVMSGGVSLAVWMGGVATEIDRLRRNESAYGEVLDALATKPRVDVISGASAGGLNGAFLATAIACGVELKGLVEVWLQRADFGLLLRNPFEPDPASLLKGDEYFLPTLRDALAGLVRSAGPLGGSDVHLLMTLGLLTPWNTEPGSEVGRASRLPATGRAPTGIADDFGSVIPNVTHLGLFEFVRNGSRNDWTEPDAVGKLAVGARSSASFPFAFEPSFIQIGDADPHRANLRGHVNFPASTYAVDGGTLMNKPFEPALDVIYRQSSNEGVRRVLLYVVPDPGSSTVSEASDPDKPPSLGQTVLDSALTLPRTESIAAELEGIRLHNDRVIALRRLRTAELDGSMDSRAGQLYGTFVRRAVQGSVSRIITHLDEGIAAIETGVDLRVWDRRRLGVALEGARARYYPESFADATDFTEAERWGWGTQVVIDIADSSLDLLGRGLSLTDLATTEPAARLGSAKALTHAARTDVLILQSFDHGFWMEQATSAFQALSEQGLPDPVASWADEAFHRWISTINRQCRARFDTDVLPFLQARAMSVAEVLAGTIPTLSQVADAASSWSPQRAEEVMHAVTVLTGSGRGPTPMLRSLLAQHVTVGVTVQIAPECDQLIRLMMISGDTPNAFNADAQAVGKLAGIQLGHFGAFYKASWRANDWMFGRLDGAWRLTQALLAPERLFQLFHGRREEAWKLVEQIATASTSDDRQVSAYLAEPRGEWAPDRAKEELAFLEGAEAIPPALPLCAAGIARRIQLEILREEIPRLRRAIDQDRDAKASTATSRALRAAWPTIPERKGSSSASGSGGAHPPSGPGEPLGTPSPEQAVHLFGLNDVKRESITDEVGYDLFTLNASTAAAVTMNALGGTGISFGPLRAVFGALKNFTLLLYVLARSTVTRSRTAFALTTVAIVLAALVVILPMADLIAPPPRLFTLLAWTFLVAAGAWVWLSSGAGWGGLVLIVLTVVGVALPLGGIKPPPEVPAGEHQAIWDFLRGVARPVLAVTALIAIPWLYAGIARRFHRSSFARDRRHKASSSGKTR